MKTYSINEIFYSLQGEGFYAGRAAIFIRFAGCNLRCPFCDTDFSRGENLTADYILAKCRGLLPAGNPAPPLVVLTGGEPTLQVDAELLALLHSVFPEIAMETNGTRPIPAGVDFVTCSPKGDYLSQDYHPIPEANEVKVVYDGERNPSKWMRIIKARHYFVQPCDTGDPAKNASILEATIRFILTNPRWRLSLQQQKIINVK